MEISEYELTRGVRIPFMAVPDIQSTGLCHLSRVRGLSCDIKEKGVGSARAR
jgi:hypothetical protein